MQKVATISAEFLADVSSREKEKAKEAKGNDLVFRPRSQKKGKGYLADDQVPDDQAFYGKKGKKGGKKGGKKQKDSFKSSKKGKEFEGRLQLIFWQSEHGQFFSLRRARRCYGSHCRWARCMVGRLLLGLQLRMPGFILSNGINQHESWNYFVHDGWDVRTGQQCNGVSTDFFNHWHNAMYYFLVGNVFALF